MLKGQSRMPAALVRELAGTACGRRRLRIVSLSTACCGELCRTSMHIVYAITRSLKVADRLRYSASAAPVFFHVLFRAVLPEVPP